MRDESLNCWLCGAEADSWALTVARVCNACYADPDQRLRRAGYQVAATDPTGADHVVTVTAPPGREPMLALIFGPENLRTQIKKLFVAEVQVGERRFDDKVYLEFADKADIPLLQGFEIEQLIMELVKDGTVHLIGDHADVHIHGTRREHSDTQLVLLCAALLNAVFERQQLLGHR